MNTKLCKLLVLITACVIGFGTFLVHAHDEREDNSAELSLNTGMADAEALIQQFDRYLAQRPNTNQVNLSLLGLRGLSAEAINAGGNVQIDLTTGQVTSTVAGLPAEGSFELWLADNRPGRGNSAFADRSDVLIQVGKYQAASGAHTLTTMLSVERLKDLALDRAFVTRAGKSPAEAFVLTGGANLYERLAQRQVRLVDRPEATRGFDPTARNTRRENFTKLVAAGRQVFLQETFQGNGRTCATCHVESNNLTIDPEFIATLPRRDPLFVAETNPALAKNFENPELLRKLGLFVENADGFDDLSQKFTLRAAQNVQALTNSMTRPDPIFGVDFTSNGNNADPVERLGWSNDGPALREFAIVAIVQHNPKTLGRKAGSDFRVPTDEELDALAAYQLSIGRQEDFDLPKLELATSQAELGRKLFLDTGFIGEPGHKNCNACHFNAGGTGAMNFNPDAPGFSPLLDSNPRGFNLTNGTNANETPLALALKLPRDGGFGSLSLPTGGFGNTGEIPGVGIIPLEEFNSTPLVESADTAPFFHNHTVKDLEAAVAFYGSAAFKDGQLSIGNPNAGGPVPVKISDDPKDPEVQAISAFLRVLNVLENIRSSISLVERGQQMRDPRDSRDLARLAFAETDDAWEVIQAGALQGNHEASVREARDHLRAAKSLLAYAHRLSPPFLLRFTLARAVRDLRAARTALANPRTLPRSYRN